MVRLLSIVFNVFGYENFYPLNTSGTDEKKSSDWGYPALYKVNNQPLWVLISEAGISRQNCATKLNNKQNTNLYKVTYPAAKKSFHGGAVSNLPWNSQWHVMIVGGLADLVESVAWVYGAYNHGSKDYKKVIEYIDLAVKMNCLMYLLTGNGMQWQTEEPLTMP